MSHIAADLRSLTEVEFTTTAPIVEDDAPVDEPGEASELNEDAPEVIGPPPRPAAEDGGQLLECYDTVMASSGHYHDRTLEEKLREACGTLRYAISEEAEKGLGDDGRTRRKINEDEDYPWAAVEKMLTKRIHPNLFKSLVAEARGVLEAYYE